MSKFLLILLIQILCSSRVGGEEIHITIGTSNNREDKLKDQVQNPSQTDTIKLLKERSQKLVQEKNYEEAYHVFNFIAEYYKTERNQRMSFDYRNKSENCHSKYCETSASLNAVSILINDYLLSNLTDTIISSSIVKNFIRNYSASDLIPAKLTILDNILRNGEVKLAISEQVLLAKHRVELTKSLGNEKDHINSYFKLLNLPLKTKDEINYQIDLGHYYFDINEFNLSNITLQSLLFVKPSEEYKQNEIFNLIGNNYLHLKKFALAFYYYDKILRRSIRDQNNREQLRVIYNNIGNYYSLVNKVDSAMIFYNKALKESILEYGFNSKETAFEQNNIGNLFFNINNFDSALVYYTSSYEIKKTIDCTNSIETTHNIYNIAKTEYKRGNISIAIDYLKKSLLKNFTIAKLMSAKEGLSSSSDYIFSCKSLGEIYYKLAIDNHNQKFLDSARFFNKNALKIADSITHSTQIESSKFRTNLANNDLVQQSIKCYLNKDLNGNYLITDTLTTISLFDKCHNYILFNEIITNSSNFKNPLNSTTKGLSLNINKIYNEVETLENQKDLNLDRVYQLNNLIFSHLKETSSAKINHHSNQLLKDFPIMGTSIFKSIPKNTLIIEFTAIGDSIYEMQLTQDNIAIKNIGETSKIHSLMNRCMNNIKEYSIDFAQLKYLSDIILGQFDIIPKGIKKIIIIRDEFTITVPFDLILRGNPCINPQENRYLIQDFDILYSNSLNQLFSPLNKNTRQVDFDFIGFAPELNDTKKIIGKDILTNSITEINNISNLFAINKKKSIVYQGNLANIETFAKIATKTKILHLATHSMTLKNNEFGLILNSLNLDHSVQLVSYFNILELDGSPDLVVLASCSSNYGEYLNGEGVKNLARAFFILGTTNVIYSLYKLDDEFSCKFMSAFYKKLIFSDNILNSLCLTKREFIKDDKFWYPTYWSNLNLIGK